MPQVGLSRSEVLSDLNLTINMRKNTVGHLECIFFGNRNIVFSFLCTFLCTFLDCIVLLLYWYIKCIILLIVLAHKVHNEINNKNTDPSK